MFEHVVLRHFKIFASNDGRKTTIYKHHILRLGEPDQERKKLLSNAEHHHHLRASIANHYQSNLKREIPNEREEKEKMSSFI